MLRNPANWGLCFALLLLLTRCSGGGAASSHPGPAAAVVAGSSLLLPDLAPGANGTGTLVLNISSLGQHTFSLEAASSQPTVTVALPSQLPRLATDAGTLTVPFTVNVAAGADAGLLATLTFTLRDQSADAQTLMVIPKVLQVADYAVRVSIQVDVPAEAGAGERVEGVATVLAQGPAGTNLHLDLQSLFGQASELVITPATLAVHRPQIFTCPVSFRLGPTLLPGAQEGVLVLASTNTRTYYNYGLTSVRAYPTFTFFMAPDTSLGAYPGSTSTLEVVLQSLHGFSKPVALAMAGLPAGVEASFEPATLALAADGLARSSLKLTFPPGFQPQSLSAAVQATDDTLARTFPLTLTNPGKPGFRVRSTTTLLSLAPGERQKFQVEVTSTRNFAGPVDLTCEGLPGGAYAQFDPPRVHLSANQAQLVDLYLLVDEAFPLCPTQVGFSLGGSSQDTRQDPPLGGEGIPILDVTREAKAEISTVRSWFPVEVGTTANWNVHLRSIHGYAGPVALTSNGAYTGSSLAPVVFAQPTVNLQVNQEQDVACSLLLTDAAIGNEYRLPIPVGISSSLAGMGGAGLYLWPTHNRNFFAEVPAAVPLLPKGGTVAFAIPVVSTFGLQTDLLLAPAAGDVWPGVHYAAGTAPTHVQPGVPGLLACTLQTYSNAVAGQSALPLYLLSADGQAPVRYGAWKVPFVVTDPACKRLLRRTHGQLPAQGRSRRSGPAGKGGVRVGLRRDRPARPRPGAFPVDARPAGRGPDCGGGEDRDDRPAPSRTEGVRLQADGHRQRRGPPAELGRLRQSGLRWPIPSGFGQTQHPVPVDSPR
jgi:hypothetical protein